MVSLSLSRSLPTFVPFGMNQLLHFILPSTTLPLETAGTEYLGKEDKETGCSLRLPDLAAELQYGSPSLSFSLPSSSLSSLLSFFILPVSFPAIISHLSRTDLVALSLTCLCFAETVAPFLWRTITLSEELPTLRPLLRSLQSTLLAKPYLASYVRTLNVQLGAGEFAEGNEWDLVGRVASLLPDVRELDLRSDSVGRWKGIWDPFLRALKGRRGGNGRGWRRLQWTS